MNNKTLTMISLFVSGSLLINGVATNSLGKIGHLDNQTKTKITSELIRGNSEIIDNYLVQLAIQNRYITAQRIVWVYGCADKT